MKRQILTLSLLTGISFFGMAQPTLEWEKSFGGASTDGANSIKHTSDGGSIVAGQSASSSDDVTNPHGQLDYWVAKLSSDGTLEWQKTYGGTGEDIATSIVPTSDGGYIMTGYSNSADGDVTNLNGNTDIWVVKITSNGTISWQKTLGGTGTEYSGNIIETSGGGYMIAGRSNSLDGDVTGGHGAMDAWLVKLTSTGSIDWQKTYGGSGEEGAIFIKETSDAGFFFTGYTTSTDGDLTSNQGGYDYWGVKVSSTGVLDWQKNLGGTSEDIAYTMDETANGDFILSGSSLSSNGDITNAKGNYDFWVAKLSASGVLLNEGSFGGDNDDDARAIKATSDGGFLIAGRTSTFENGDVTGQNGSQDFWLAKIKADFTLDWQVCMGGTSADYANAISILNDGTEILLAGASNSANGDVTTNYGASDYWVVKLSDPSVGVNELSNVISFYPNPTTNNLTIESLSKIESIAIFDIKGALVQTETSNHFSVKDLQQGVYIIHVKTINGVFTKRLIKE